MLERPLDGDQLIGDPGPTPESSGWKYLDLARFLDGVHTTKSAGRQDVHPRGVKRTRQCRFENGREPDSAVVIPRAADAFLGRVSNCPPVIAPFGIALPDVLRNSDPEIPNGNRELASRLLDAANGRIGPKCVAAMVYRVPAKLRYRHEGRRSKGRNAWQTVLEDLASAFGHLLDLLKLCHPRNGQDRIVFLARSRVRIYLHGFQGPVCRFVDWIGHDDLAPLGSVPIDEDPESHSKHGMYRRQKAAAVDLHRLRQPMVEG